MIQRDKIIAENLVKIRNILENFSKSSESICLFAKISVPLQRNSCDGKKHELDAK